MAAGHPYKFTLRRQAEYLRLISEDGLGRCAAAHAVGISDRQVRHHAESHPEFVESRDLAEMEKHEKVADALFQTALAGNVVAQQVYLYNRCPEMWADRRNLQLTGRGGGPIRTATEIEDLSRLSAEDLAQLAAINAKLEPDTT
jgi:hypothetical protein